MNASEKISNEKLMQFVYSNNLRCFFKHFLAKTFHLRTEKWRLKYKSMKGNVKLPEKCRLGGFKIRHKREFYIFMKEEFYIFCLTSHFSLIPYLKKALVTLRNVLSTGLPIFTFEIQAPL